MMPFVNQTVDRWNARSQTLQAQIQGNKKAFGKTIIEQVKQMIEDDHIMDRLVEKTQLKRDTFQIEGLQDINEDKNPNIYNDHDFYQLLLSDFLAMNDQEAGGDKNEGGDDFLYGADLSLT